MAQTVRPSRLDNRPRGIRNNNPLNIRIGNVWLGEVDNPTDPDFEQFVSMVYGLRAAFVLMRRYIKHYHRDTVPAIIAAWAPATENNTMAYVDRVCMLSGLSPAQKISYDDMPSLCKLVMAMITVECGSKHGVAESLVEKAYHMA